MSKPRLFDLRADVTEPVVLVFSHREVEQEQEDLASVLARLRVFLGSPQKTEKIVR